MNLAHWLSPLARLMLGFDRGDALMTALDPVELNVDVPLPVDQAFDLFTDGIATWWPYGSISVTKPSSPNIRFDRTVGGEIFEVADDGTKHVWGTVQSYDRPRSLVLQWHPGRASETAQRLEVRFIDLAGRTRVSLVHSEWERLVDEAEKTHQSYIPGWKFVLGECYRAAADHLAAPRTDVSSIIR